ncbi:MAG TPA: hypothetical protein VGC54_07065 [Planctomycetota bacterium]
MMGVLGGMAVVVCAWLAGRALLPARAVLARDRWEEQGVAYLLGAAALVVAAMLATRLGVPFHAPLAFALLAAAAAAGIWRLRCERRVPDPYLPCALGGWMRALMVVLGAGSVLVTIAFPLSEFDPLFHFAYKGKILHGTGNPFDGAFTEVLGSTEVPGVGRVMTHPNYPLGIPFLQAFAAHAGFGWSERWVLLPLSLWAACLPAAVSLALRGFSTAAARWGALIAAATPMLYVRNFPRSGAVDFRSAGLDGTKTLGGGGDLAVAALFAAGCALYLRARQSGRSRTALLAGLALAGAAMMKNEGLGLLGVAAIAMLVTDPLMGRRRWAMSALAVAAAILLAAPWLSHRARLPAIDENYGEQLTFARLADYWTGMEPVERSPLALTGRVDKEDLGTGELRRSILYRYYHSEFTDFLSFGVLWLLVLLSVPVGASFRQAELRWLAAVVAGGLLMYALILLVTPWGLTHLRPMGIPDRLFLHLIGPAAMLAGLRVGLLDASADPHAGAQGREARVRASA